MYHFCVNYIVTLTFITARHRSFGRYRFTGVCYSFQGVGMHGPMFLPEGWYAWIQVPSRGWVCQVYPREGTPPHPGRYSPQEWVCQAHPLEGTPLPWKIHLPCVGIPDTPPRKVHPLEGTPLPVLTFSGGH